MEYVLVAVVLVAVAWLVAAPLRPGWREQREAADAGLRDELEALKEARYREIRDAELDYRTGKLSEADWRTLDRALRRDAVEILRRLDELEEPAAREADGPPRG